MSDEKRIRQLIAVKYIQLDEHIFNAERGDITNDKMIEILVDAHIEILSMHITGYLAAGKGLEEKDWNEWREKAKLKFEAIFNKTLEGYFRFKNSTFGKIMGQIGFMKN